MPSKAAFWAFLGVISVFALLASAVPYAPIIYDLDGFPEETPESQPLPHPMFTAWTIANHSHFSAAWFMPQRNDTLTINSGGDVVIDYPVRLIAGIGTMNNTIINAGGKLTIVSGADWVGAGTPKWNITDTQSVTVNEGGQLAALGQSTSRIAITGSNPATAAHYIITNTGGKFYAQFTDITNFYYGLYTSWGGEVELKNATISSIGSHIFYCVRHGGVTLSNCTIAASGAAYILSASYSASFKAINTAFTTAAANALAAATYGLYLTYAGCTYQGVAIAADDFSFTTQDIDIRIYEESHVKSSIPGARWSVSHPHMDAYGQIYNSNQSLYIPGYLPFGTGNTSLFLLSWSAYWPSGMTVANRNVNFWNTSRGAAAGGLYNDQWNITASAWGYSTNSTEVWAGTNATVNMTAPTIAPPGLEADAFVGTYDFWGVFRTNYTNGEHSYPDGTITFTNSTTATLNVTVRDNAGTDIMWLANTTDSYTAHVGILLTTSTGLLDIDTALLVNGSYVVCVKLTDANITDTYIYGGFAVNAQLVPALENSCILSTYWDAAETIIQANYTWGENHGNWTWVFLDGIIQFNIDCVLTLNITIDDPNGLGTVLWLMNQTYAFTGGLTVALTTINGGLLDFNTTSLPINSTYDAILTLSSANITTTYLSTQFYVGHHNVTGANDDFYIQLFDSDAYTASRGNFTVSPNEAIYPEGYVTLTESLTNADVNVTVLDMLGLEVAWIFNGTADFAQYTGYTLNAIMGAPNHVHADVLGIGEYFIEWAITDTEIWGMGRIRAYAVFTVSLQRGAFVNISAYNSNLTTSLNMTNRFDWNALNFAWFNGTIGTSYPVNIANVLITINTPSNVLVSTLYTGTHTFTGGNESTTHITGGVLNWSCSLLGEYRISVDVWRANVLNHTVVTESFWVQNLSFPINSIIGGPVRYRYVTFFEWKLKEGLAVTFTDRTTVVYPVQAVSYLWNFGDGVGDSSYNPVHKYSIPGIYTVNYTVTFNNGDVYSYSTTVEVVDTAMSFWMYCAIGILVFIGILGIGAWSVKAQSRKLAIAMWLLLCGFIVIFLIVMQQFIG